MEEEDSEDSLSNLLCKETIESLFISQEEEQQLEQQQASFLGFTTTNSFVSENEDEYIQMLIQRENSPNLANRSSSNTTQEWFISARLDSITWILKRREFLGFCFRTAYLAITYLDQYLSKRTINIEKVWSFRPLSVACLTIAAKMEETNAPPFSQIKPQDWDFEIKDIRRMEIHVLITLEWRMASITPFPYLRYFISKLRGQPRVNDLLPKTVAHVLAILERINLLDQRPSSIAAAAVLVISDRELTRNMVEVRLTALSQCGPLNNDQVFTCYNLMLEKATEKPITPNNLDSPYQSPVQSTPSTDVIDDTLIPSASRTDKRRRLTFDQDTDDGQ